MDTTAAHVGQIFFDQDLIDEVEQLEPYSSNTQSRMSNSGDDIFAQEAATSDPFMEYVYLGDSVRDGLLAWLAFGVNTTATHAYQVGAAAFHYKDGGILNPSYTFELPSGAFPPPTSTRTAV